MRLYAVFLILLIPLQLFAPFDFNKSTTKQTIKVEQEESILDYCLVELKDGTNKTRKEVFHLAKNAIKVYLKRKHYTDHFLIQDSLADALACIFVSESSNARGRPAKSSLWILHFNPFGLTSSRGDVIKTSWEMVKGKRVVMNRVFRSFNSFEEAVDSLLCDYLLKLRFEPLMNCLTVKDFLYTLRDCGYMTDSNWPNFAYNEIYLKSIQTF